jgi:DNA-binding beta-propeller fold protein YncE
MIGSLATAQRTASSSTGSTQGQETPTGKIITPTAAQGAFFQDLNPGHAEAPDVRADGPASLAVSPDGKWLAVLASGFNVFFDHAGKTSPQLATEYVFLFDVTGPQPKQVQVLPIRASFQGIAWAPSSNQLFVSGGIDDLVAEFVRKDSSFVPGRTLKMGHKRWVGPDPETLLGAKIYWHACPGCSGEVGGLAVSPDGKQLLATNMMNDSVSLIDIASGEIVTERDLRPGVIDPTHQGEPGGSYPGAVLWISPSRAYVASERDREIIALAVSQRQIQVVRRTPVQGQPVALLANRRGSRLYVALDTTNRIAIFDTSRDRQVESLDVVAPEKVYANSKGLTGANTNALALTPDERTLLVSNGGENAIAVVRLSDSARGLASSHRKTKDRGDDDDESSPERSLVVGLAPTGWYPSGVATSKDGTKWYVVNGKSPTGPNVNWCKETDPERKLCIDPTKPTAADNFRIDLTALNQHLEQLEKAGLLTMHEPAPPELAQLTKQVARNDGFDRPDKTAADEKLFSFLRQHIKHVIYIMKENRSYDHILGDLDVGNGDPRFTVFPEKITPNHHAIARNFIDLDNTLVSGEGSPQGWTWTYAAQDTDYNERNEAHFYGAGGVPARGVSFDMYGNNRAINMGHTTSKERHDELSFSPTDPNILPGIHDVNAPDGPGGSEGKGYIWDVALRQGLTVRNYGLAGWLRFYSFPTPVREPHAQGVRVFWTAKASLMPFTDPYYFPFWPAYPDYWRVKEWKREFSEFCAANSVPNLMMMWLGNDHMGLWDRAIDGVNTPETQVADNDYAVGSIVEAVANSPIADSTLIFTIEDDAWDGPDHVDSHRTIVLVAGAYVRQHTVVSTRYTTVSVVKTIEEVLGMGPIGLNDALAAPMSDIFDSNAATWSYKAIVPNVLRSTQLPLPPDEHAKIEFPSHSAAYWMKATAGQDFSGADRIDPVAFNRALWEGLKGNQPYPIASTKAERGMKESPATRDREEAPAR